MLNNNIQYALMASAANETGHSAAHRPMLPDGWHKIDGALSGQGGLTGDLGHCEHQSSGFEAAAYRNGNKIVISYAGTNVDDLKEWFADLEIAAVGTANQQIKDAAAFYQEVKAANPDAEISFTGHSLGGGLAALMGVFFDKPALTFDPAPFRLAAAQNVADKVAAYLSANGYLPDADLATYHTDEQPLAAVDNLGALLGLDIIGANRYPTTIRGESNIQAFALKGEFLTDGLDAGLGLVANAMNALRIMDSLTIVDTNDAGSGLNFGDYHSIDLLTLAMAAPDLAEIAATLPQTFAAIMKDDKAYADHGDDTSPFLTHLLNQSLHHGQYAFLNGFSNDLGSVSDYVQAHAEQPLVNSQAWQRLVIDMTIDHYYRHDGSTSTPPALHWDNDVLHFNTALATPDAWMNEYIAVTSGTTVLTDGMIKAFVHDAPALSWYSALDDAGHTLNGAAEEQNVLLGLNGDDALFGGAGSDLLIGGAGNDTLYGNGGADILIGGWGNDVYYVDSTDDVVHEVLGQGTDTVLSAVDYHLSHNLENLLLQGGADLIGRGNYHDNIVLGNAGDNVLYGESGDDVLGGGAGGDLLIGGSGSDRYLFNLGDGHDVIDDQGRLMDQDGVIFGRGLSFADLHLTLDDRGLLFQFAGNDQDSVCIANWQDGAGARIEYCQFDDGHYLALHDIEQLITVI